MRWVAVPFIVVSLFACKKAVFHKERVTGLVLHNVNKQPLPDETLTLYITSYRLGEKSDEFPGGTPIYSMQQHIVRTDNQGRFMIDVEVANEWIYSVQLKNANFIQKRPLLNTGFSFPGNPGALKQARETFDTIFAERPAYVRYGVKNINEKYDNDSVSITPYHSLIPVASTPGTVVGRAADWTFTGTFVDQIIIDTVPSESEPHVPIRWFYKRSDTVTSKYEWISISPHNTTDYIIHY